MASFRSGRAETPAGVPFATATLAHPDDARGLQELWYLLVRREWISLAVVSPERSERTWPLTNSLGDLAMRHGRVVTALNGTKIDLAQTAAISHLVSPRPGAPKRDDPRFLVAVDSPVDNPLAIGVLAACETVLLLLEMGTTSIPRAQRTIELIGRDRIIGAVLFGS